MFNASILTFQEFVMREPLPLATIQQAVLEFLQGRDDVVVFGAQAVNAYVDQPRMTQDIDLLSPRAKDLVQELQGYLRQRFHIAVRMRQVSQERGYRLFQVRKSGNRHLVDVRPVEKLPLAQRIGDVLVMAPAELIAYKVIAYHQRRGQPKSGTDWRDLALLLLRFPDLKRDLGPVVDCLRAAGADPAVLTVWQEFVAQEIRPEEEEDE
ncbi:MAG: nucleotidyl transferase AbiEii/AbiGii toxin family protein [Candidatus Tectomicrobia bacterium]|uniref:Nucleotidyl transferase AbiEii/AbiGii toxin family protein n=1 Tax=Tectimicrobiota bacterium TaxID=2528274 RepID=A0A932FXA3_UNCTE|nr:nucleotidyl transferase AbiEii/AbiGii toxin family protein [Candidatus Tectomicrobia bacterium]